MKKFKYNNKQCYIVSEFFNGKCVKVAFTDGSGTMFLEKSDLVINAALQDLRRENSRNNTDARIGNLQAAFFKK